MYTLSPEQEKIHQLALSLAKKHATVEEDLVRAKARGVFARSREMHARGP